MIEAWSDDLRPVATIIAWIVIAAGLAQVALYLAQLVLAGYALFRRPPVARAQLLWQRYGDVAPPIALLVPAYNEEANIVESVSSLLALEYPNFEVIVVNDGSRDATLARLVEAFGLQPVRRPYEDALAHEPIDAIYGSAANERLIVASKRNGGKADALNAAIDLARAPIVCAIDGDSILEPDALIRAAQPFIDDPGRTLGVGGTIRIANGSRIEAGRVVETALPRRLLPLIQVVEYLRAFLMARLAWSQMNSLMLVSGAFGVFRRAELVEVGGYRRDTVGEDLELVVRLHRHMIDRDEDYRIVFIPEPVCWTEAPESLAVLGRQRSRWQRGALETFAAHRDMLFGRRYGLVGSLGFGHLLIVDVIGPITEVLGYVLIPLFWALGLLSLDHLLAFAAIVFSYGIFVSVCSLILEELELKRFPRARDLAVLTLVAVFENFGYRQLTNLWRLRGYWQYLTADRSWGDMARVGLAGARKS